MNQKWNSNLYDNNHKFVSEYGSSLLNLLLPQETEKILDLGCGTGDLTYEISKLCSSVIGIDVSKDMIEKAKSKYSEVQFEVKDASNLNFIEDASMDIVICSDILEPVFSFRTARKKSPYGRDACIQGAHQDQSRHLRCYPDQIPSRH